MVLIKNKEKVEGFFWGIYSLLIFAGVLALIAGARGKIWSDFFLSFGKVPLWGQLSFLAPLIPAYFLGAKIKHLLLLLLVILGVLLCGVGMEKLF